ncbi:MAG: infB [Rickettsiaceae bacterium]|jgi:translation initiation factor IF-2|nr:infB [Rickettsiaceae bacterium]
MTETDNKDDKPKKLTLSGNKLSLNKTVDVSALKKNFITSRTNTVTVEVKRNKISPQGLGKATKDEGDNAAVVRDAGGLTNAEVNARLNVLKRAAETSKHRQENEAKTLDESIEFNEASEVNIEELDSAKEPESILKVPSLDKNEASKTLSVLEHNKRVLSSSVANAEPKISAPQSQPIKHQAKNEKAADLESDEEIEAKKLADAKSAFAKVKKEEPRKLKKTDIFNLLDDEGESVRTRSLASIRRAREKEKRKHIAAPIEKLYREVVLPENISVGDLANRMSERVADVIKELMKLGIIASASQTIDADTAELVASTLGHTVKRVQESDVENILTTLDDKPEGLMPRAPVVTVMGHVDHGKTSLLDALKSTDIAAREAGGITQHIGAYRVELESGKHITFIDTPGHEAFTEMRTRGAKVTDIVILVVAADDGIKAQTVEAINHAKAAGVPIIVAVNKIDKPDANPDKVKNELLMHDLVAEDLGGDIIIVPVSALKRINLDKLLESVLLVAEMLELKANPNAPASGAVIEARVDKGKGAVATVLVQRGTLKVGDLVVAGQAYGKVKRMLNDKGIDIHETTPSMPVEIIGLDKPPHAGDQFAVAQTEKQARDISEYRERKERELKVSAAKKVSLEDLFSKASGDGSIKELPMIIKGDVQGSIEAIVGSLDKLPSQEVRVKILHTAVGGITESDVALAQASNAIIVGFNVRASGTAASMADKNNVDIRYYSIIYNLIDDVKLVMSGMLSPIIREEYIGSVEIRQVFNITKVGKIAGSYVTKGIIKRGAGMRLLRDDIVIHEGKLKTLRRFKDDVKEVKEGYECGIALENYEDIRVGDKIEVFELVEEKRTL